MSVILGIFIITAFVCVLIFALILCRAAQIGDEAEAELFKRICADAVLRRGLRGAGRESMTLFFAGKDRARLMSDELDTTRFYGEDYEGPGGRA